MFDGLSCIEWRPFRVASSLINKTLLALTTLRFSIFFRLKTSLQIFPTKLLLQRKKTAIHYTFKVPVTKQSIQHECKCFYSLRIINVNYQLIYLLSINLLIMTNHEQLSSLTRGRLIFCLVQNKPT